MPWYVTLSDPDKITAARIQEAAIDRHTAAILKLASVFQEGFQKMDEAFNTLSASVTEISGAADSAVALIKGLADQLVAHANDPAKVLEFAAALQNKASDLGAAVAANTPPAPAPAPEPAPQG